MSEEIKIERVMGIFAHPDDPEFFCGATFARWAAEGAEIIFVMATSGDKGSDDPEMSSERLAQIREEEECNAAKALGVKDVVFLRHPDGEVMPTLELREELTRLIRTHKPDVVVTSDPTAYWYGRNYINHPDHRNIGAATLEAVFPIARDRLNFLQHEADGLSTHKVRFVYLAIPAEPDTHVDVTDYVETKIRALREHKSQIKDMDAMAERMRERTLDKTAPPGTTRHIESFRVFELR